VRHGAEACELADKIGDSAISSWAGLGYGTALLEAGDPERGLQILLEKSGGMDAHQIPGGWRAHTLMEITRAATASGNLEVARESAAAAAVAAKETGLPMSDSWADRSRGEVLLSEGEFEQAAAAALSAADKAAAQGARLHRAGARELAGRAFVHAGKKQEAIEQFELTAAELDECGAAHHRDRVERELGKLGRRSSRRSRAGGAGEGGIDSLSGREKEVADLVVDRHTNAEIAEKLFLSEKTVESHLRNIFRKLEVSSRVEVARTMERERV
jgi:DNA-binding CsgD family transcriptional regulator